eukprot:363374-Chlamydomonas_euryale.AAC.5
MHLLWVGKWGGAPTATQRVWGPHGVRPARGPACKHRAEPVTTPASASAVAGTLCTRATCGADGQLGHQLWRPLVEGQGLFCESCCVASRRLHGTAPHRARHPASSTGIEAWGGELTARQPPPSVPRPSKLTVAR